MNKGYIYITLITIAFSYLLYLYIPIWKKSKRQDKLEKEMISYTYYQGRSFW